MNEPAPKKTLVQKLAEVMGEVERVAKRGRNDFHKYDYATESDILSAVREHMAKHSLMLVPSVEDIQWRSDSNCLLKVRFTVYDGDPVPKLSVSTDTVWSQMEALSFIVYGEGQDKGDKATYKAMTGATKYALLKLFKIPTGDDPEHEPPAKAKPWERPKRQSNEEALERAPYRDRQVDTTTGEISSPAPAQEPLDVDTRTPRERGEEAPAIDDEAIFAPLSPEEARKTMVSQLNGRLRTQGNKMGLTDAAKKIYWKIYIGEGVRPMQAPPEKLMEFIQFLVDAESKGLDLNAETA